jgi:hypothetical protein
MGLFYFPEGKKKPSDAKESAQTMQAHPTPCCRTRNRKKVLHTTWRKRSFFWGGFFCVCLFGFLRPKKRKGNKKQDTKKRITLQSMNA